MPPEFGTAAALPDYVPFVIVETKVAMEVRGALGVPVTVPDGNQGVRGTEVLCLQT